MAGVGDAIWARVELLAGELRRGGVEVGPSELADAARAASAVDLGRRAELRVALSATLVKHAHHQPLFSAAFDRAFPARLGPGEAAAGAGAASSDDRPEAGTGEGSSRALEERLGASLSGADEAELRLLAELAVEEHAGLAEGVRGERYHVYRVLRSVDLARLLSDAIRRAHARGDEVDRPELDARVEALRRLIVEAVRARLAADATRRPEAVTAAPFDVELARASHRELEEMRAAVRPLARRLASRLRRRRTSTRSGRVNVRATIRRSLPTGGIPFEPAYKRPHVSRPEVFVLCDVSGSVADFAGFTLTFISALAGELSNTRCFAFVDEVDDITELVRGATAPVEPWQILQHGRVIGADGHSDYGAVLESFRDRFGQDLTDRSTLIVTGDARTNHRPHRADVLAGLAGRARAVYWLDPEPRAEWGTTDSSMPAYAEHCDGVFEVRTLRQLSAAVEHIL